MKLVPSVSRRWRYDGGFSLGNVGSLPLLEVGPMCLLTKPQLAVFVAIFCVVFAAEKTVTAQETLYIKAHNDKPAGTAGVRITVDAKDAGDGNLLTTDLFWNANDDSYSAKTLSIPSATRILRFTFKDDCCGACALGCGSCDPVGQPDCDRNAAIDFFTVFGILRLGTSFDRTGSPGCAAGSAGGRTAVVCGQEGAFVEYDIAPCPDLPVKWSQLPSDEGFVGPSSINWLDMAENVVTADDFVSDGRRILGVRFWGSDVPPGGPVDIDGWLISFHADGGSGVPTDLLGLYFCPKEKIAMEPTAIGTCISTRVVVEYCVLLDNCCPIHIDRVDPRDDSRPASAECFAEVAESRYWLDVQAVVGHTYDPVTCALLNTDTSASGNFWGWHKSPGLTLDPPVAGEVAMDEDDWVYTWQALPLPVCDQDKNQAFELLTREPPRFKRGDVTCDGCVNFYDVQRLLGSGLGGGPPLCCDDAADANGDGFLDHVVDALFIAMYLAGGAPPPAPGPTVCGTDPMDDELDCKDYPEEACHAECNLRLPCDCNEDGVIDISDFVCMLNFLFNGIPPALPCGNRPAQLNLFDANADGDIDLSDAIFKLGWFFNGTDYPGPLADHPRMCLDGTCLDCILVPDCPENCPP